MKILEKVAIVLVLVTISVVSITVITPWYTKVETHSKEISQIDSEISKVMGLTGAAAGASAVISLLPDDNCTPIAEQLAEFSKYFLVVLSALYLEKYLLTVFGYAAFTFLLPGACFFAAIWVLTRKQTVANISKKMIIGAIALALLIPTGARVSGLIEETYENKIEETIQEAERITVAADSEDANWFEKFTQWLSNAAVTVSDYVTGLLSKFVESLALMIVTSCLIPILVVVIFVWLFKVLIGGQKYVSVTNMVKKEKHNNNKPELPESAE